MADVADMAMAEQEVRHQIALIKARLVGVSATHCEDCDAEIPERRRALLPGVQTCVDCQEIREAQR